MPLIVFSILVQVALIIHIVKTGRNTMWIWIVMMVPVAGTLAYLIIEVLPSLTSGRQARQAKSNVTRIFQPNRDVDAATRQLNISDTVENKVRLAREYLAKQAYVDAKDLLQECLTGLNRFDPDILYDLAQAEYGLHNLEQVREVLDTLIAENPAYKNQDAHLLYARTLDGLGLQDEARHEYETLHGYYSGPQASYYYGVFLKKHQEVNEAERIFKGILDKAELAGKSYQTLHRECLKDTRQAMHD